MILTPRPVPADRDEQTRRQAGRRYDWDKVEIGVWQNWLCPGPNDTPITDREARLRADTLRVAASSWAHRRGLKVRTRRFDNGRTLDLLFTPDADR